MPKFFFDRIKGKRHPSFLQRLGLFLPSRPEGQVIWIHAVSVGEVKSAAPFFRILKEKFPDAWIFVTTTTATGQEEAKRSLKSAGAYLYMPFDFSFVASLFVNKLRPDLFFLVESDFWPNHLKAVKRGGGKTFLISGKLSKKAASRWRYIPKFAQKMFSNIDLLCVQTEEDKTRLLPFTSKISITGNLKFDFQPQETNQLPVPLDRIFITLGCTHSPEEEWLLDLLKESPWTLFLAPRHPERFVEVADLLAKKKISFIRWKDLPNLHEEKVVLVDCMGQLASCYLLSKLAIVGGSFVTHVGGHNVLEPCLYGCPSLFGPHTFTQNLLVEKVLTAQAGLQKSLEGVRDGVEEILEKRADFSSRALDLVRKSRGASLRTWETIFPIYQKN